METNSNFIYGCIDCGKSFQSATGKSISSRLCYNCCVKHVIEKGLPLHMAKNFSDTQFAIKKGLMAERNSMKTENCICCSNDFQTDKELEFGNRFCDTCRDNLVKRFALPEEFRWKLNNKLLAANEPYFKEFMRIMKKCLEPIKQEIEESKVSHIFGCVDCNKSFRSPRKLDIAERFCKNCRIKHIRMNGLDMKTLESFRDEEFVKSKGLI